MSAAPSLRTLFGRYPPELVPPDRAVASVLVVGREASGDIEVLLIERAEDERDPASGQIGLPGGHVEPADRSLNQTAVRECDEEIGIARRDLRDDPRFVMVSRALASRLRVAVFVAELADEHRTPRAVDPHEVASVFWFPRRALGSVENVDLETPEGKRSVPAVRFGRYVLWGFTLRVLRVIFDLEPPRQHDELPSPATVTSL